MTNYPKLQPKKIVREVTDTFRGYNHNLRIKDGEFYDLCNLTSDEFPLLSTRESRTVKDIQTDSGTNIFEFATAYKDHDIYSLHFAPIQIEGTNTYEYHFYILKNRKPILISDTQILHIKYGEGELSLDVIKSLTSKSKIISFGAYIIVFPINFYYNTIDPADYGTLNGYSQYEAEGINVSLLLDSEFNRIEPLDYIAGTEKPSTDVAQHYWIERDDHGKGINLYRKKNNEWVIDQQGKAYRTVKFESTVVQSSAIAVGDYVKISATPSSGYVLPSQFPIKLPNYYKIEGYFISGGVNFGAVVKGEISPEYEFEITTGESVTFSASREMPDVDFVCEANNRLWGCKYGRLTHDKYDDAQKKLVSVTGNINELYCSALGDFKNWNKFDGISTDSWAASVGSDGEWTGCIVFNSDPIFFKENRAHRISTSATGAHRVTEYTCDGVEAGSARSIAVIDNIVYYKSHNGITLFDSGVTQTIYKPFGNKRYFDAVAGVYNKKYYISMLEDRNDYSTEKLFVYDTERKIFSVENTVPEYICIYFYNGEDNKLFSVHRKGNNIYTKEVEYYAGEEKVKWFCESGIIGYDYPDRKYVTRYLIRAKLEAGAAVNIFIEYDSSGTWEPAGRIQVETTNSFLLPVRPHRCDHLRIRLEGEGNVKIFSIARELCKGSDKP